MHNLHALGVKADWPLGAVTLVPPSADAVVVRADSGSNLPSLLLQPVDAHGQLVVDNTNTYIAVAALTPPDGADTRTGVWNTSRIVNASLPMAPAEFYNAAEMGGTVLVRRSPAATGPSTSVSRYMSVSFDSLSVVAPHGYTVRGTVSMLPPGDALPLTVYTGVNPCKGMQRINLHPSPCGSVSSTAAPGPVSDVLRTFQLRRRLAVDHSLWCCVRRCWW